MLLRNMDPPQLCNGTRLAVKRLMSHIIEATFFTSCGQGEDVFIPLTCHLTLGDWSFPLIEVLL